MSRKRMRPTETLAPFYEVRPNDAPEFLSRIRRLVADDDPEGAVREHLAQIIFTNDRYTVFIRNFIAQDGRKMRHLSIKRADRDLIDDWRVLQQIKNLFAGPDVNAVQVFPREAHLVDASNQWHLWCYMDEGFELPFGFREREVLGPAEASKWGARQRPFD